MTEFQSLIVQAAEWVAIAIIGVLSAARLSRLVVADAWPPSIWLRIKWDTITKDNSWSKLVHCPFCFAPWSWAFVLAWGLIWDWPTPWWIFNSWMAGAYIAAIVQVRDQPKNGGE